MGNKGVSNEINSLIDNATLNENEQETIPYERTRSARYLRHNLEEEQSNAWRHVFFLEVFSADSEYMVSDSGVVMLRGWSNTEAVETYVEKYLSGVSNAVATMYQVDLEFYPNHEYVNILYSQPDYNVEIRKFKWLTLIPNYGGYLDYFANTLVDGLNRKIDSTFEEYHEDNIHSLTRKKVRALRLGKKADVPYEDITNVDLRRYGNSETEESGFNVKFIYEEHSSSNYVRFKASAQAIYQVGSDTGLVGYFYTNEISPVWTADLQPS
ncbi:hypothetical protein GI584_01395 [Gracilibacillus salitolerans]|uniref:Uncharacterized protein n=1 Tax=Gracilibacillus salitolerans TaxID=2663022 RepID=A0A5Q2TF75_9BACI|nr:hypothetical protein [Gracilibacillus salitolerans]QGH32792.1 hypothetical protein GI584_01395 [Gracilibacillus salitolerans]